MSIHDDPPKYSPEEDAILRKHWLDPKIKLVDIARMLPIQRTAGSIKHRGHKIGLGKKAAYKPPTGQQLTPWPIGVRFDDHPKTETDRLGRQRIKGEV